MRERIVKVTAEWYVLESEAEQARQDIAIAFRDSDAALFQAHGALVSATNGALPEGCEEFFNEHRAED